MLRCLYTAASGMEANETQMDVISNNLANASTTGFKKVTAGFEDLLSETIRQPTGPNTASGNTEGQPTGLQVGLGTRVATTSLTLTQGDMINTNNPFDLAIQGSGYFKVQQADGTFGYTRAGNFTVSSQGRLVTQSGLVVEPGITVPQQATQVTINPDGTVLATLAGQAQPQQLGQIELATFTNPGGLVAQGGNLFTESSASGQAITTKSGEQGTGTISQGFLEGSNVQAVNEMIDMIAAQRSYEMNSKVISTADDMLSRLTSLSASDT